jgi:hypothetical protein
MQKENSKNKTSSCYFFFFFLKWPLFSYSLRSLFPGPTFVLCLFHWSGHGIISAPQPMAMTGQSIWPNPQPNRM